LWNFPPTTSVSSPANRLIRGSSIHAEGVKAMKTQAWGWLATAVLAAGLNASYHDGGFPWAHRIVGRVGHSTSAVLALATGRADQFLAEASTIAAHRQSSSCPLEAAAAEMQAALAPAEAHFAQFEQMTARQEAQLAKIEAKRARIEARLIRIRIPAVALSRIEVPTPKVSVCPRMRGNVPRMPMIKVPAAPVIHIDTGNLGPV